MDYVNVLRRSVNCFRFGYTLLMTDRRETDLTFFIVICYLLERTTAGHRCCCCDSFMNVIDCMTFILLVLTR